MNRLLVFVLFSLLLLLGSSCNSVINNQDVQSEVILPNGFEDFLAKFHADKEFQLAHIQFPLQGLPTMMKESQADLEGFTWEKENWIMHHEFDPDNGEFEQTFTLMGDDLVLEKILHLNGNLGLERRYVRSDDSWTMIYYAGMNFIRQ